MPSRPGLRWQIVISAEAGNREPWAQSSPNRTHAAGMRKDNRQANAQFQTRYLDLREDVSLQDWTESRDLGAARQIQVGDIVGRFEFDQSWSLRAATNRKVAISSAEGFVVSSIGLAPFGVKHVEQFFRRLDAHVGPLKQ